MGSNDMPIELTRSPLWFPAMQEDYYGIMPMDEHKDEMIVAADEGTMMLTGIEKPAIVTPCTSVDDQDLPYRRGGSDGGSVIQSSCTMDVQTASPQILNFPDLRSSTTSAFSPAAPSYSYAVPLSPTSATAMSSMGMNIVATTAPVGSMGTSSAFSSSASAGPAGGGAGRASPARVSLCSRQDEDGTGWGASSSMGRGHRHGHSLSTDSSCSSAIVYDIEENDGRRFFEF